MLIGYARVSTNEQNLDLQRDALRKAGVSAKNLYTDKITGTKSERPGLQAALSHLREGDTLVVWRLDRLGRSLKHLIETVTALASKALPFKASRRILIRQPQPASWCFTSSGPWQSLSAISSQSERWQGLTLPGRGGEKADDPSSTPPQERLPWRKSCIVIGHSLFPKSAKTLHISKATLYRWINAGGGNQWQP